MSTSLLYHGFGIIGYQYQRTLFEKGTIIFRINMNRLSYRCHCCNHRDVILRDNRTRRFRALPIGSMSVFVEFDIPRVECLICGVVRQIKLKFAEPRRSYTRGFERYASELSRHMTILDVANHLNVSWEGCHQRYPETIFAQTFQTYLSQGFEADCNFCLIHLENISICQRSL